MMKRNVAGLVLTMLFGAVAAAGVTPQGNPNLTGTWVGLTTVPNVGEDAVTLELRRDGETYTGRCTDAAGVIVAPEITNVAFKDGTLTFDIGVSGGTNTVPVHIALKVAGDTMAGLWSTDEGESAEIRLTRKVK